MLENNFEIIGKTLAGFEDILLQEVSELGIKNAEKINRGIKLNGSISDLYMLNYQSSLALRFLVPINSFSAHNEEQLYRGVKHYDWSKVFNLDQTFAVDATTFHSRLDHSLYVALKSKDAIADQFREKFNKRPNVDAEDPDIRINIHLVGNKCTVSLDSSGRSLHIRGYKNKNGIAPLNEVLAAGMIRLSGWDQKTKLLDPMCGSGTLLTEAAMLYYNVPAGKFRRKFCFQKWNNFNADLFSGIKKEADNKIITKPDGIIEGSDKDRRCIPDTRSNLAGCGLSQMVNIKKEDFFESKGAADEGMIIMNPPYDERIKLDDAKEFYQSIGNTLKHNYEGYTAWILSGDMESAKHIGLKPSRKIKLYNGQLECKFLKFELYSGSKKRINN